MQWTMYAPTQQTGIGIHYPEICSGIERNRVRCANKAGDGKPLPTTTAITSELNSITSKIKIRLKWTHISLIRKEYIAILILSRSSMFTFSRKSQIVLNCIKQTMTYGKSWRNESNVIPNSSIILHADTAQKTFNVRVWVCVHECTHPNQKSCDSQTSSEVSERKLLSPLAAETVFNVGLSRMIRKYLGPAADFTE